MNNFHACLLGILQGLLEYLPISSSFHLGLAKNFFSVESSSLFDVSCHAGTLLSAIIFFRKDFQRLLQNRKIFLWLILALLPLGFGYIFWRKSRAFFPSYLGIFFSSFCLFYASLKRKEKPFPLYKKREAFFLGAMQTLAIFPGVSRSGVTVSPSLIQGAAVKDAVLLSFFLAVPTISGGLFLETIEAFHLGASIEIQPLLIAFLAAFFTGSFTVRFIYQIFKKPYLKGFSIYLFFLALYLSFK